MAKAWKRLAYALLLGIVGAGIVHIAVLMMIPVFSERDAWSRVSALGQPYGFMPLDRSGPSAGILKGADPMFEVAVCRFDLAEGVVHIAAPGAVPFWSISIFDQRGQNIYSLNDGTATGKALDIVVATPVQLIDLRKEMPADFERSVFIEADIGEGMLVLRGFVPDATWRPTVTDYLSAATCESG